MCVTLHTTVVIILIQQLEKLAQISRADHIGSGACPECESGVDLEPIPGAMDVKREYTPDETPVHGDTHFPKSLPFSY